MILPNKNKPKNDEYDANNDNDDVITIESNYDDETPNYVKKNDDNNINNDDPSNYEVHQPFFKNKWVRYILIALAIIIIIVIILLIIVSCNKSKLKGFSMTKIPILYVNEDFDFKITPDEKLENNIKYKFNIDDEQVASIAHSKLKGKNIKNTIIPNNAGETNLKIKAGKAKNNSKIIVCNRLDKNLTDTKIGLKLNKKTELNLGIGDNTECYDNIIIIPEDKDMVEIKDSTIKAIKPGKTKLNISDGKKEIQILINISTKNIYITSLSSDEKDITINAGDSKKIMVKVLPNNATNQKLIWKSSDPSIAKVDDDGNVTGLKEGSTTIKAKTDDGSNKNISFKVTVNKKVTGDNSSNNNSTYYQYRTKNIINTTMCRYYAVSSVTEYFYTVLPNIDFNSTYLSASLGIRLKYPAKQINSVVGQVGSSYYNQNYYCNQRVNNNKIYWPRNITPPSYCNVPNSRYAVPTACLPVNSRTIYPVNMFKSNKYNNAYELSYNLYLDKAKANSCMTIVRETFIPIRFKVNYYGYTKTETRECSQLSADIINRSQKFNKQSVSYSNYKWTTNKNLPNAEYTGKTKN